MFVLRTPKQTTKEREGWKLLTSSPWFCMQKIHQKPSQNYTENTSKSNPAQEQETPVFNAYFLSTEEGQNALKEFALKVKEGLFAPVFLGTKLQEIANALPILTRTFSLFSCGELISITEAASLLGMSRQTFYRHLKNEEFPSNLTTIKNNVLKVRKSELIRMIGGVINE